MFKRALVCAVLGCATLGFAQQRPQPHRFTVAHGQFELDGKPFQIISGEMHYERIPREYWRARLRMARAMGLNAITMYTFWNKHELEPGVFDFRGQNDVAEFVREAQQEGLYVLLRPGPYICAEWEFGGYPAWLLRDPAMVVRSMNPQYLRASSEYLKRLGAQLASLQLADGGPILAVQVENEYGSYGDDHAYMRAVKQQLLDAGFNSALLYTADGPEQLPRGSLPDLPAAINFGPRDARKSFATLTQFRPQGPFLAGEYWAGWFDHWGGVHAETNAGQQADEISWMLRQGYSVSIYMFHGGTSFGWMNGANIDNARYEPDVTSYDYDAPLDESGRVTPKFLMLREAIAKATGRTPPPVPDVPPMRTIPAFTLREASPLYDNLPTPLVSDRPPTMESLGQSYGYVLYRTTLSHDCTGALTLDHLHDYAQVSVNGIVAGTLDRRTGNTSLPVHCIAGATLDVLVENTGRVNYGSTLPDNHAGITGAHVGDTALTGWKTYSLPFDHPGDAHYSGKQCTGACLFRGSFPVDTPADTYLDTSSVGKGFVWVNGHALGRAWSVGPQKGLYLPAPWLHAGSNEVIVLDLESHRPVTLQGLNHAALGGRLN